MGLAKSSWPCIAIGNRQTRHRNPVCVAFLAHSVKPSTKAFFHVPTATAPMPNGTVISSGRWPHKGTEVTAKRRVQCFSHFGTFSHAQQVARRSELDFYEARLCRRDTWKQ